MPDFTKHPERPVAPIGIEMPGTCLRGRRAVIARAGARIALLIFLERIVDVVRDEQVEKAVTIEIEERGAAAPPPAAGDAGPFCDVGERAVAVVAKQLIRRAEMGDKDVDEAVAVASPTATPMPYPCAEMRGFGDVGEFDCPRAVRIVDQVVAIEARGIAPAAALPGASGSPCSTSMSRRPSLLKSNSVTLADDLR